MLRRRWQRTTPGQARLRRQVVRRRRRREEEEGGAQSEAAAAAEAPRRGPAEKPRAAAQAWQARPASDGGPGSLRPAPAARALARTRPAETRLPPRSLVRAQPSQAAESWRRLGRVGPRRRSATGAGERRYRPPGLGAGAERERRAGRAGSRAARSEARPSLLSGGGGGGRSELRSLEYGRGNGNEGEAEAHPRLPDAADERQEAHEAATNFCRIFNHLERLLDEEISRVRKDMYNDTLNGSTEKRSAELPDAVGPIVQLQEKLYVPVKEYPDFNFVGRILGPRGLTAKQLEAETGCKIMVRGKGSMRDKKKEEQNRGKPNWEHLNEDLHVLITVEDAQNRAEIKLKRAVEEVKKLLVPAAEGEDSLKKMQLMELAILNGTYRDANIKSPALAFSLAATAQAAPRIITGPAPVLPPAALRTPTPAGPTIMPLIRQIQTAVMPNGTPHPTAAIVPPGPEAGLIYTPYEYPYTLAPATSILEYPIEPSGVLGMAFPTKG
uniref:QKI, KH domain containing RNA binding n=4 Tax=Catarrhini TaxID=9526 RepID=A0A2I3M314_PAPAN